MAPQRHFVLQFGQFTSLGPIRIWQHRRHFLAVHANDYCKDVTLKGNRQPFKSFWWGFKMKAKHLISWDYGLWGRYLIMKCSNYTACAAKYIPYMQRVYGEELDLQCAFLSLRCSFGHV